MKKITLMSAVLAPFLYANIPSTDINISDDNLSVEFNTISNKDIVLNNELDYLFENTKFPVDDYIYKAGTKKPTKKEIAEEIQDIKKQAGQTKTEEVAQEIPAKIEEPKPQPKTNLNEVKAKLELNKMNFQEENQINQEANKKYKYKQMLKDELLANRTSSIKDFSNNSKFGVDSFSNQKSIDIATNEHKLTRMIRAGRLIPALLTSAISSDIGGIVTAQIEQDIYANMGRAVLIPRGSKAIGFYQSSTKIGQERLEIKWREIITPQGINILLTDAIVADNMGMTGAKGALNNKYWERYALPVGISTISNALLLGIASQVNKNTNGNNNTTTTYQEQVYNGAQSDINAVVQDIIQQHKNIQPTIEIKSGSRIFLVPTNHMWFSKPKNNEVLMKYFVE